MIPIAVVFDRDDTDSGNDDDASDDTYPTPRAIQSATPQSTKYDNPDRDIPEITTKTEKYLEDGAEIQTTFEADEGIGTSYVLYNYQNDGDGVSGDIKIPINPGRMIPIAVVFDSDFYISRNSITIILIVV
jgi:hypothetical protein